MRRFTALQTLVLAFALGCDNITTDPGPVPAEKPAFAATLISPLSFLQVSPGNLGTCAVALDNRAYCWGDNGYGQLGDGTQYIDRLTPVAVFGGLSFRQVSIGAYHTCGVTTTYRAYCWGYGQFGQLGDGGTTISQPTPVAVAGGLSFVQVSAGDLHTCGVARVRIFFQIYYPIYCWGHGRFAQLGNGSTANRLRPVPVTGGLSFSKVEAGSAHTCGLTTKNLAYCWGSNTSGAVGDGTTKTRLSPTAVAGGHHFADLSSGGGHNCGLDNSRAFCWGYNEFGQVGNGTTTRQLKPIAVVTQLTFRQVRAGGSHSCGLTLLSRQTYCWGDNEFSQLGNSAAGDHSLTPVAVSGGFQFIAVTIGDAHTCGLVSGSRAYCWGSNFFGQLGDGTTTERATPVPVLGPM